MNILPLTHEVNYASRCVLRDTCNRILLVTDIKTLTD